MKRVTGSTPDAPVPGGHYSQAVRVGGLVWTAGQGGFEPATRELVSGDVAGQTRRALANCEAALAACGATLADVVRAGVFLADLSTRREMDRVFAEVWPQSPPARTTVGAELPGGMLVEIDLTAWVDE